MAFHFRSSRVISVYGVSCVWTATDLMADGPYSGSAVPATFAKLPQLVSSASITWVESYVCLNQFIFAVRSELL